MTVTIRMKYNKEIEPFELLFTFPASCELKIRKFSGLSPSRFFLLPKDKTTLKGCRFQTTEIQENAERELRAIRENAFQEAFQQRKKCWERCIASRGDYIEGKSA
jgi:hypothetical protein